MLCSTEQLIFSQRRKYLQSRQSFITGTSLPSVQTVSSWVWLWRWGVTKYGILSSDFPAITNSIHFPLLSDVSCWIKTNFLFSRQVIKKTITYKMIQLASAGWWIVGCRDLKKFWKRIFICQCIDYWRRSLCRRRVAATSERGNLSLPPRSLERFRLGPADPWSFFFHSRSRSVGVVDTATLKSTPFF